MRGRTGPAAGEEQRDQIECTQLEEEDVLQNEPYPSVLSPTKGKVQPRNGSQRTMLPKNNISSPS